MNRVYADNAGTTAVKDRVWQAMKPYYENNYEKNDGVYRSSIYSNHESEKIKLKMASLLGVLPSQLYFMANGSSANNYAIKRLAYERRGLGNHLITSSIEHPSVLNCFKALEKEGFEVTYLPVDKVGSVDLSVLEKAIRPDTTLVSMMMVNNELGTQEPIEAMGALLKTKGIAFHVDAIQALGSQSFEVDKLNVTAMSFSGHKIHAPKGIGLLYWTGKPFESYYHNLPYEVGFCEALQINQESIEAKIKRLKALKVLFVDRMLTIDASIKLNGCMDKSHPGIVNLYMPQMDGDSWIINYDMQGIAVSSGSACSSGALNASHVLLAIGLEEKDAKKCVRFSFGDFTSESDIDRIIEVTRQLIK